MFKNTFFQFACSLLCAYVQHWRSKKKRAVVLPQTNQDLPAGSNQNQRLTEEASGDPITNEPLPWLRFTLQQMMANPQSQQFLHGMFQIYLSISILNKESCLFVLLAIFKWRSSLTTFQFQNINFICLHFLLNNNFE